MVCRLYRAACRKWGPFWNGKRVTVSAWAFAHGQETGNKWLRNRIDGLALFFFSDHNHCQASFQRHVRRAPALPTKGPRK